MKFRRTPRRIGTAKPKCAAFTFAEVLAALLFMAIVIPTAVEGVRIANLAGQVSARKSIATRIAQNQLAALKTGGQWQRGTLSGTVQEAAMVYQWTAQVEPWTQINRSNAALRLLSVRVVFQVQGRDYEVRLNTLVDVTFT